MKIGDFLKKCNKEEIPFYLYNGTSDGYKISCINCDFFKQNENGIWKCESIFLHSCQDEFGKWLDEEI